MRKTTAESVAVVTYFLIGSNAREVELTHTPFYVRHDMSDVGSVVSDQIDLRKEVEHTYTQTVKHVCIECGKCGLEDGVPRHEEHCNLSGTKCDLDWRQAYEEEYMNEHVKAEAEEVKLPEVTA